MILFSISSWDFLQKPEHSIHPAFKKWAETKESDNISVVWILDKQNHTLPIAVHHETNSKHTESAVDYLELASDGKSFKKTEIAKLRLKEKKHLLKKTEEIFEADLGLGGWKEVKGELFRTEGNATYFPSKGDPGVHLLTEGFSKEGIQTIWEVQNDKSIKLSEEKGAKKVGSITSVEKIHGFDVQGPVQLHPKSKYPARARDHFLVHALVALMIMPIHRPANMTKLLWWLKKLGSIGLNEGSGAL